MAARLDPEVDEASKYISDLVLESPRTPLSQIPSPLRTSSLHFVRSVSLETPTARGFLRSLSDDLPVFKSPPKKRTARKSLKDILGTEPQSPGSGDEISICSAPAQCQHGSHKSTVLLSEPSQLTSRTLGLLATPVTRSLPPPITSDETDRARPLATSTAIPRPHTLLPLTNRAPPANMTGSPSHPKEPAASLKDRIAMFQHGADRSTAPADVAKKEGRFVASHRSSKDTISTADSTNDHPVTADLPTGRRASAGRRRSSDNGSVAGVADAVKKLQASNTPRQTNDRDNDSDDDSEPGKSKLGSVHKRDAPNRRSADGSNHSRDSEHLSLASLYAKPTAPPLPPHTVDPGTETDDASVVVETAEQLAQRKARRLAAREQLQNDVAVKATSSGRQASCGALSSSDDESVAPDRLRRAGKRKVKLRACDLGLTEAELKSLDPQELQLRIKLWKKDHPRAGETDEPISGASEQRGVEADRIRSRSRSRADVKRRSKSSSRRHSGKGPSQDDHVGEKDLPAARERSPSKEGEGQERKTPDAARHRTPSRRRSSRAGTSVDEDQSVVTSITTPTSRRQRSTARRRSGTASVVSAAEGSSTKLRSFGRSKSVGRPRPSGGESALGTALDQVSSHGDEKRGARRHTNERTETTRHKSRHRSKSVSCISERSRHDDEPASPQSPRDRPKKATKQTRRSSNKSIESPEKSGSSSHRRSRSSAASSRHSSSHGVPQFEAAKMASLEAEPSVSGSKTVEWAAPTNGAGKLNEGRKEGMDELFDCGFAVSSPTSPDFYYSDRKPIRTVSDMSPTKLGMHAFKKIRGVFSSRSSDQLMDEIDSPTNSPNKSPTSRGTYRTRSGDSIFNVLNEGNTKGSQGSPKRGVLRQPSGGTEAFLDGSETVRKGSRREISDCPRTPEVETILEVGISEEQLRKLEAAGFLIQKKEY